MRTPTERNRLRRTIGALTGIPAGIVIFYLCDPLWAALLQIHPVFGALVLSSYFALCILAGAWGARIAQRRFCVHEDRPIRHGKLRCLHCRRVMDKSVLEKSAT